MCLLPFRMSRGRGRGRRQRGFDDDNGFEAWGGYMNAKKAKLEEQYLKDRGMYGCSNKFWMETILMKISSARN